MRPLISSGVFCPVSSGGIGRTKYTLVIHEVGFCPGPFRPFASSDEINPKDINNLFSSDTLPPKGGGFLSDEIPPGGGLSLAVGQEEDQR